MRLLLMAGLAALAPIVLSNDLASAGSVHLGNAKAEVQAARMQLYEREMHLRDDDSTAFDRTFPVLGKILASEQGYGEFLSHHTFEKLLCVHTPFLWRVVAGDIFYHKVHPFVIPPLVPDSSPGPHVDIPPSYPDIHPHDHIDDPGGPGIHTNAVPEPSSWVLLTGGATVALLAATRRQLYVFLKKRRACGACQKMIPPDLRKLPGL
jgi:hypothetical protein